MHRRISHNLWRQRASLAPSLACLVGLGVVPVLVLGLVPGSARADIEPRAGTATFTDLTGGGACSFPGEPPDNLHVGISSAEFGTADVCGAYLDVVGPRGTVRVKITDHCRRCPVGVVDITRKAFALIADIDAGRAPVHYELVRNPPLTPPLSLRVKPGSSPWFLQLQVLDHGNPLRSVELEGPDGGWRPLTRTADNHWQASSPGPGEGPFTVRISDVHGQSATVFDVKLDTTEPQTTDARLYQPAAPPPPPSTVPEPAADRWPEPATPAVTPPTDPRPRRGGSSAELLPLLTCGLLVVAVAARATVRRRWRGQA